MPEGDSVYRASKKLTRALAGQEITEFSMRVPRYATADLRGMRVHGCQPRGKHMLLHIGEFTVHSHFGMDGAWLIEPAADAPGGRTPNRRARPPRTRETWSKPPSARVPEHRIRAVVGTETATALGIDLAKLELWPAREDAARMAWLGPDLLDPEVDLEEATRRILADPDRPISAALLDQRNVAGIGNVYATELMFLRGLLPERPVRDVPDMAGVMRLAQRLLVANRDRLGRTFTGNTRAGERTYVYGRGGMPCRRCGTRIVRGMHASGVRDDRGNDALAPGGTRISTWCPHCQR